MNEAVRPLTAFAAAADARRHPERLFHVERGNDFAGIRLLHRRADIPALLREQGGPP